MLCNVRTKNVRISVNRASQSCDVIPISYTFTIIISRKTHFTIFPYRSFVCEQPTRCIFSSLPSPVFDKWRQHRQCSQHVKCSFINGICMDLFVYDRQSKQESHQICNEQTLVDVFGSHSALMPYKCIKYGLVCQNTWMPFWKSFLLLLIIVLMARAIFFRIFSQAGHSIWKVSSEFRWKSTFFSTWKNDEKESIELRCVYWNNPKNGVDFSCDLAKFVYKLIDFLWTTTPPFRKSHRIRFECNWIVFGCEAERKVIPIKIAGYKQAHLNESD